LVLLTLLMLTPLVSADYVGAVKADEEAVKDSFRPPGYSPYAGQDARAFGVILGPEEAYRFARGDEISSSHGATANGSNCRVRWTGWLCRTTPMPWAR
jgi:hypothetical protein